MKKILLEFEKLRAPFCGLGTVCTNLGHSLIEENPSDLDFHFYLPKNRFGYFGDNQNYVPVNKIHRKLHLFSPNADVYHLIHQDSPYFPSPLGKKTPVIMTIQDLNFLYEEKDNIKKRISSLQKRVNRVDQIVCTSEHTKKDVLNHLKVRSNQNILVNKLGVNKFSAQNIKKPSFIPDFIKEENFLFTIAVILPKKNFECLIDMMKLLPNEKLIMAGSTYHPYAKNILQRIQDEGLSDRIFLPGEIDNDEKYWCLENCKAFLFPSKVEGFGLPPLEAMQKGKPCFLSSLTSLPEIGGPHGYYFENFEAEHMKEVFVKGMGEFNNNPDKKNQLMDWSNQYCWKKSSQKYIELYKNL